jgi:3-deoxy-manno-octulosonate cytidylyltransferase (CMP-KDO synthetase)
MKLPFITAIIPARYGSTRFPAKPLIDLEGKTMIRRVYEQVKKAKYVNQIIVATDDDRIKDEVLSWGGEVVMTLPSHPSGTDRCWEALQLSRFYLQTEFVINVQGDEPLIHPDQIDELASMLTPEVQIATQAHLINDISILINENTAKVVLNNEHNALYFSRQAIPFVRTKPQNEWLEQHTFWQHIGIYAYRKDVLQRISQLKPSSLELVEGLEQLRWLENGYSIKVGITWHASLAIDIPADAVKVRNLLKSGNHS